ncbi:MAG: hypothetical protein LKI78_02530 [Bifidobacterium tibiigranuli]|nr:hypothetical protein [Bifidobacterium tibiigranuli]
MAQTLKKADAKRLRVFVRDVIHHRCSVFDDVFDSVLDNAVPRNRESAKKEKGMKGMLRKRLAALIAAAVMLLAGAVATQTAQAATGGTPVPVYRVYNRRSGLHHYTMNADERYALINLGWSDESTSFYAAGQGSSSGLAPVYREYNPHNGNHNWTLNQAEHNKLVSLGWRSEGVAWYANTAGPVAVYRLYNPHSGEHVYTTNAAEYAAVGKAGWHQEGIAWKGLAAPAGSNATNGVFKEAMQKATGSYVFTAGHGGWATGMKVLSDGSFFGKYTAGYLGDTGPGYEGGTYYQSIFSGRFSSAQKNTDGTYILQCDTSAFRTQGKLGDVNFVKYGNATARVITAQTYGMNPCNSFALYPKGYAVAKLNEQAKSWMINADIGETVTILPGPAIYNRSNGETFYSGFAGFDNPNLYR